MLYVVYPIEMRYNLRFVDVCGDFAGFHHVCVDFFS